MSLGPSYSGSTLSMRQALESLPALCLPEVETLHVRIVTGTATSPRNPIVLQNPLGSAAPVSCRGKPVPLDVTYTATVHDDGTLRRALHDELARINPAWRNGNRVALLVESNTPWGAGLEPPKNGTQAGAAATATDVFGEALRLHFPLHVSHLAAVPDRRSIAPQLSRGIPLVPKAAILRLEDSVTPMDKLPTFTPDTSAPTIDLVLLRTLDNLERQGIGAVGIFATDVRDFLFLAREINRVAPNVLLFGAEPNILMLHHEYQPFVRGAIVASTYPLYSRTQALTGRSKRRKQFTSMGAQGRYNALLHLLGRDELLLDYATPTAASEEAGRQKPDPWVLVAGQHGFLPLGTRRVAGGVYPTMMTPASRAEPPDVDPPAYLFATWQKQVFWMLPALLAAAHLGLIVVSRYHRVPGLTAFATHRVHRPLHASAARLRGYRWRQHSLEAERRLLILVSALCLTLFLGWQLRLWSLVYASDPRGYVLMALSGAGGVAALLLGIALAVVSARRVMLAGRYRRSIRKARAGPARRWYDGLRDTGPELLSFFAVILGLTMGAFVWYYAIVWPFTDATGLFTIERTMRVGSLTSPAPQIIALLAVPYVWSVWSLRTLHFHAVTAPDAIVILRYIIYFDQRDRQLERELRWAIVSSIHQIGKYQFAPLLWVIGVLLLVGPRLASIDGPVMGAALMTGTALGLMAVIIEVSQAAWLGRRVKVVLERLRLHPLGAVVGSLSGGPIDWRPSLQPPHGTARRLLLRGLVELSPGAATQLASEDPKLTLLRTDTWQAALEHARLRATVLHRLYWRQQRTPEDQWQRAEQFVALIIALLVRTLVTRVVRGLGIAVGLGLVLFGGHLLYMFSGRNLALMIDLAVLCVTAIIAARILIKIERDHVLSVLWKGTPGALGWNSGLLLRALTYVAIPLLTLFAIRFPEAGGQLLGWIEPLRQLLPTP